MWVVNTSNKGKRSEFLGFFGDDVKFLEHDLEEPSSDMVTIVRYKASQFEGVVIDDTSLEIEGVDVGVNIRWFVDRLDECLGKKAVFTCLVGLNKEGKVHIYKGVCEGTIVEPRGESYGFNKYFLPVGSDKTFAQEKPDSINPRKIAVDNMIRGNAWKVCEVLKTWDGEFQ